MITFTDGTEMTWEEAAVKIEAEGQLITRYVELAGYRCAVGVLGNFQRIHGKLTGRWWPIGGVVDALVAANNAFEGTPEERAVYMAAWCRKQEEA